MSAQQTKNKGWGSKRPNIKGVRTTARKTTTSNEVKDRWKAAHYTRLNIYLDKETATAYKAKCAESGLTFSDVPKDAIEKFLSES